MNLFPDQLAPDAPTGLGTAMAGGKGKLNLEKTARRARDFYPTPPEATRAFLHAEAAAMAAHGHIVWECCGHGGAIARELVRDGAFAVTATDVAPDPANDVFALDILQAPAPLAAVVVTNPPFALAGLMLDHLLGRLRVPYLALLLKTTFFSTDTEDRGQLARYRAFPPSMRWDMTWRVDFTGGCQSTMNCSWFVWDTRRRARHEDGLRWRLLTRHGPVGTRTDLFSQENEG